MVDMSDQHVKSSAELLEFAADVDPAAREQIASLLASWLDPKALVGTTVSVLAGGAINRSFLVEGQATKNVLRIAPDPRHTDEVGVDMANSAVVARIAGAAGVGPEVLGVQMPEGHSLIEFIPGVLNVETLREGARLHDVGVCVRELHTLTTEGVRGVSTFAEIDDWLARADAQDGRSADEFREFAGRLARVRELIESVEGRCLSHRDLNPQNCIHSGDGARLIDWDFSGVDTPYLDLAMLTTYADLSETEARTFWAAATGEVLDEDVARIELMRFAHALREWAWTRMARAALVDNTRTDLALLPSEAEAAGDFYVAYGDVNWRFAQRFAADARFESWIEKASSSLPAPGFR
jgi:thiamine kinase-like enzyme